MLWYQVENFKSSFPFLGGKIEDQFSWWGLFLGLLTRNSLHRGYYDCKFHVEEFKMSDKQSDIRGGKGGLYQST